MLLPVGVAEEPVFGMTSHDSVLNLLSRMESNSANCSIVREEIAGTDGEDAAGAAVLVSPAATLPLVVLVPTITVAEDGDVFCAVESAAGGGAVDTACCC